MLQVEKLANGHCHCHDELEWSVDSVDDQVKTVALEVKTLEMDTLVERKGGD